MSTVGILDRDLPSFEEFVRRHFLVRIHIIERLPAATDYKERKLSTVVEMCSYHGDVLLRTQWSYNQPCYDYHEIVKVEVTNLRGRTDHLLAMLSSWLDRPGWVQKVPEVVTLSLAGRIRFISCGETHVLQQLARFHAAVAATVVQGHEFQHYLCNLTYWLDSFISSQNHRIESDHGLLIQTPVSKSIGE